MALANSYVSIRVSAWRISQRHRRPRPSGAEDIGTWETIVELLSYFAVVINGLILAFTGHFLANHTVRAGSEKGASISLQLVS